MSRVVDLNEIEFIKGSCFDTILVFDVVVNVLNKIEKDFDEQFRNKIINAEEYELLKNVLQHRRNTYESAIERQVMYARKNYTRKEFVETMVAYEKHFRYEHRLFEKTYRRFRVQFFKMLFVK